jgi:BMFP domain-containing protein YqiC
MQAMGDIMRSARENLKFMEDMARMATGAAGSFGEIRNQVKGLVKEGLDRMMSEMDMVTRAEFERVEAIAVKARERQEQLEKRLKDLEKQLKTKKAKK